MNTRLSEAEKTLSLARKAIPLVTWVIPLVLAILAVLSAVGPALPAPWAWKLLPLGLALGIGKELVKQVPDHPLGQFYLQAVKIQALILIAGSLAMLLLSVTSLPWLARVLEVALVFLHLVIAGRIAPQMREAAMAP